MSMNDRDIDYVEIYYMDLYQRRDVMVQVKDTLAFRSGPSIFIVEETMVPFEKHIAYASDLSMSARHLCD